MYSDVRMITTNPEGKQSTPFIMTHEEFALATAEEWPADWSFVAWSDLSPF